MKNIIKFCSVLFLFVSIISCVFADTDNIKLIKKNNKLFSIGIPSDLSGTFITKRKNNGIFVYHKESKKAGFGGFAFGIKAFKEPKEYASAPGTIKIGELADKNGRLYDIAIIQPTDVQYDYTKSSKAPKSFQQLYDLGYKQKVKIEGVKGSKFYNHQGTKGKDLYRDVLEKHIIAINEKWDSARLEKEGMSYMYNVLRTNNSNLLDKIGYTYYDANGDGIDELLIGEIADGAWKGVIYDIYTMVDRKPQHVISGGTRDRYYICDGSFLCNEYSSGALESGVNVYIILENSTELFPQVSFKYDGYANSKQPWFISYSDEKWKNVSEAVFKERKSVFDRYERFDFIPIRQALN